MDRFGSPDRFYWLCLAVALLVTLGYRNVLRAPLGRAFTAVRDSEVSAQAMGVNLTRTKAAAFGLSCMATGWAGALMGHFVYTFNHEAFTIFISIQLLLMIVIGGLGRDPGRLVRRDRGRARSAGDHHRAGLGDGGVRRSRSLAVPGLEAADLRADPRSSSSCSSRTASTAAS